MARPKRWIHCAECGRNKLHYAHGLCRRCYDRQWNETHPEKARERNRRYRETRREEERERSRSYREAYPEKNRKMLREYQRWWRKANPEKSRENGRRRRALQNGAIIGPVDEAAIFERDKVCIYCGSGEDLTLDHLTPLARGGPHRQDNLAVACRSCNSSKGTKTYDEFVKEA